MCQLARANTICCMLVHYSKNGNGPVNIYIYIYIYFFFHRNIVALDKHKV